MDALAHVSAALVEDLIARSGLRVVDRAVVPGRPPSRRAAPDALHATVREALGRMYPGGIYSHQAAAIEEAIAGRDVCLATPTASGKSLAFMSAAAHHVLSDPGARVLALYPMKALIRDQLAKWEAFLAPLGVKVGFIDGSVRMEQRGAILSSCRVVAMTPDVLHAWAMSHLADREVGPFIRALRLLVLDEAHVYEGVFGTNMAYLLRRLAVVAGPHRVIASTATVGEPAKFMEALTGRAMTVLGPEADGSAGYEKALLAVESDPKTSFDSVVKLLKALASHGQGRFLAFADSRKAVERLTAAVHRVDKGEIEDDAPTDDAGADRLPSESVLPYRAGYEEEDRERIQTALAQGTLAGVVSTNALELGLDIGDLDVVVLTNSPPTTKAFHQRIGRAGRRRPAVCVVIDDLKVVAPFASYLQRPAAPGWIYLDNRYIQYSQGLCAAAELQSLGISDAAQPAFAGLPSGFAGFVANELHPTHAVEDDLFALKQQGQGTPHYAFPIRNAAEQSFEVSAAAALRLGTLSYAQLLREAYPGAVYYYLARPYRIRRVDHRRREVHAVRERFLTTQPNTQAMVFVDFGSKVLQARRSPNGFLAEVELQVSERVVGFTEKRGKNRTLHEYGPGSSYSQRPLTRYLRTTGVCWAFPGRVARSEALAERIMEAFCRVCGVLEHDLGFGVFKASRGPFDAAPVDGMVVYDGTDGSLRLTQRLMERLGEVLPAAVDLDRIDAPLRAELFRLGAELGALEPVDLGQAPVPPEQEGDWVVVVAGAQRAMLLDGSGGPQEVMVVTYRYTPQGLMYELADDKPARWLVPSRRIQPLDGITKMLRVNLVTGEEVPVPA